MESTMAQHDAILIPGGGVKDDGELPLWVQSRLDHAIKLRDTEYIVTLSGGTVYKCPPRDVSGFPIFESIAAAQYLINHGVNPDVILTETSSYDTVGNAYFSRVIHMEPGGFRRLLIITSEFHMPRTRAIFQWMYNLDNQARKYHLTFDAVADVGIPADDLQARLDKEASSLKQFLTNTATIHTLRDCHQWLFTKHAAYALSATPDKITDRSINTY
jgi:uncharacterized SAM-binding protein YcdF (DUF218 family)